MEIIVLSWFLILIYFGVQDSRSDSDRQMEYGVQTTESQYHTQSRSVSRISPRVGSSASSYLKRSRDRVSGTWDSSTNEHREDTILEP